MENLFYPNSKAAYSFNENMRFSLIESLKYIANTYTEYSLADAQQELLKKILQIESVKNISPIIYGLYYRIAFSIFNEDFKTTNNLISKLIDLEKISLNEDDFKIEIDSFQSKNISDYKDIYIDSIGDLEGFLLENVDEKVAQKFISQLKKVLTVLRDNYHELYLEINALLKHIILISGKGERVFNGIAPYQLWRLLYLNPDKNLNFENLLETLIHEVSHIYLFGNTVNEPLVLNDADETHFSPIRQKERPIDGIFHAMFVSGRVYHCLTEIQKNYHFENNVLIDGVKSRNYKIYQESYKIIKQKAKLSSVGKQIFSDISKLQS